MEFICNFCGDELLNNTIRSHIEFRCSGSHSFECVECKEDFGPEEAIKHSVCFKAHELKGIKEYSKRCRTGRITPDSWLKVILEISPSNYKARPQNLRWLQTPPGCEIAFSLGSHREITKHSKIEKQIFRNSHLFAAHLHRLFVAAMSKFTTLKLSSNSGKCSTVLSQSPLKMENPRKWIPSPRIPKNSTGSLPS